MANGKRWTAEEMAVAKAGFEAGLTHPEIAAQLPGRTMRSVRHILHDMGCVWSGDELQRRRDMAIERARIRSAEVAKIAAQGRHAGRFTRIDQIGSCGPRPDELRVSAIRSDMRFREAYCAAAVRNGWVVREVRA